MGFSMGFSPAKNLHLLWIFLHVPIFSHFKKKQTYILFHPTVQPLQDGKPRHLALHRPSRPWHFAPAAAAPAAAAGAASAARGCP